MTNVPLIYLPATKDRPAEPAPYLLTDEETIRLLRLDGGQDPYQALKRYRAKGLRGTQIGKHIRYQLPDVIEFLRLLRDTNPR